MDVSSLRPKSQFDVHSFAIEVPNLTFLFAQKTQAAQTQRQPRAESNLKGTSAFSMYNECKRCPFCLKELLQQKSLAKHLRGIRKVEQQSANGIAAMTYGVILRREERKENEEETKDDASEDEYIGAASYSDEEEQVDLGVQTELDRLPNERFQEAQGSDETEWNRFTDRLYPFSNIESMIVHVLMNGDNDMISERMMKKILFLLKLVLLIAEKTFRDNRRVRLPSLNELMRYQENKRSKIPVFPSKKLEVKIKEDKKVDVFINLPSDHLQLLAANPKKATAIFSVPDHTPDQSACLQQGDKWRKNKFFQQPMWTVNGVDVWSGDVVLVADDQQDMHYFLIDSFFKMQGEMFALTHHMFFSENINLVEIMEASTKLPISQLRSIVSVDRGMPAAGCNSKFAKTELTGSLKQLFTASHRLKIPVEGYQNKFYKVKERSSIENIHFVGALQKKDGASGVSMIPALVQDLLMLERGVIMYSALDREKILVTAPLLWIEADSPCHSELCGLLGLTTLYPCRKCYILLRRGQNALLDAQHYLTDHTPRTKDHYLIAASSADRASLISNAPEEGKTSSAKDLSFKNRETRESNQTKDTFYLLQNIDLIYTFHEDAISTEIIDGDSLVEKKYLYRLIGQLNLNPNNTYDPQQDTPTEILHSMLLGAVKYLVNDLDKIVLTKQQLEQVSNRLKEHRDATGFSRLFSREFSHCGSFLGRNYKTLVQILLIILTTHFPQAEDHLARIIPCFSKLGEQFIKHIREHILHTNKLNVSKQVAVKFGKQSMMRHVIDRGSWTTNDGLRVETGSRIFEFVSEQGGDFYHNISGGTSELTNNNDNAYQLTALKNGMFTAFTFKDTKAENMLVNIETDLLLAVKYRQQPLWINNKVFSVLLLLTKQ
ncbi:hypothetical protein EDC96DRAFT_578892 [Choanephora cucurbitarum]|nr:hypothetical protein EDC96DRAFT_578892 [Choanephora cucurbitarum]